MGGKAAANPADSELMRSGVRRIQLRARIIAKRVLDSFPKWNPVTYPEGGLLPGIPAACKYSGGFVGLSPDLRVETTKLGGQSGKIDKAGEDAGGKINGFAVVNLVHRVQGGRRRNRRCG